MQDAEAREPTEKQKDLYRAVGKAMMGIYADVQPDNMHQVIETLGYMIGEMAALSGKTEEESIDLIVESVYRGTRSPMVRSVIAEKMAEYRKSKN